MTPSHDAHASLLPPLATVSRTWQAAIEHRTFASLTISSEDLAAFARVLYLFDGSDEDALAAARAHWRALKGREGVEPVYWTQGEKGWQKAGV